MSDLKISQLPELYYGEVQNGDYLPVVDISSGVTKKIRSDSFWMPVSDVVTTQAGIATNAKNDALAIKTEIRNWYYGPLAADPTTRPDGTAMQEGDEYHNSTDHVRKVYSSGSWVDVSLTALAGSTGAAKVGAVAAGGVGSTNVQVYLDSLDSNKASKAELAGTGGATMLGLVSPVGMTATTVQAAIEELDSEKATAANLAASSGSSLVGYDGGTVQDVLDAVTGPNGAASVGYTPAGTGAVATTVQSKLQETVSVFDFMTAEQIDAVRNGSKAEDVTAAIVLAIYYARNDPKRPAVKLPAGWFGVSSTLQLSGGIRLVGEHNGSQTTALVWLGNGAGPVIEISPTAAGLTYRNAVEGITIHGQLLSDVVRPKPIGIRIKNSSEIFISSVSIFDCTSAFEIDCAAILWFDKTSTSNCAKAFSFNQTSASVISSMIVLNELNIWNTSDAIFSFDSGAVNNIFVSDSWFEYHQNVIKNGNTGSYTTGWNNFVFARTKMSDVAASGYANSKLINVTAAASAVSQWFINTSFQECNITVNSSDYICKFDLNGNTGATTDIGGGLTIDNSLMFGAPTSVVNSNTNKTTLRVKGSSYAQSAYYSGSVIPFSSGSVRLLDSNDLIQYAPAWTSSGTAPSIGNGSLIGRYMVRNGVCRVQLELTVGSTTTIGTGTYSFSLPIAHAAGWGQEVGTCSILVAGTGYFVGATLVASGASVAQVATHGASALMSQTTPAALTAGSKVSICIEYVVV